MKMILAIALRHLNRQRLLSVAIALVMLFLTALLALLPAYAQVIAVRHLALSLQQATPQERNITLTAPRSYTPNAAVMGDALAEIRDMVISQTEFRSRVLATDVAMQIEGGINIRRLELNSMTRLNERVYLIEGKFPDVWQPANAREAMQSPKAEALITTGVAERTGLQVGDTITSTSGSVFFIVGTVDILEPDNDVWFSDGNPYGIRLDALDINTDIAIVPLIIPIASMKEYFPYHTTESRLILDFEQVTITTVANLRNVLDKMSRYIGNTGLVMTTNLDSILAQYDADLEMAQITLYLLTAQSLAFSLYALSVIAQFMMERSETEVAMMRSRGMTRLQITLVFAIVYAILTLPTIIAGPLLSRGLSLIIWPGSGWESIPIPQTTRWIATLNSLLAWAVLSFATYHASGQGLNQIQRQRGRPQKRTGMHKAYLDFVLLVFGGLIYWQLSQSGNIMATGGKGIVVDPVLLLGPSVLLVAVGMVSLRILPLLIGGLHMLVRSNRGIMLPYASARLSRSPAAVSRIILLISITAGLVLFGFSFDNTLRHQQQEMAHYISGADLRMKLTPATTDEYLSAYRDYPSTQVYRAPLRGYSTGVITLIAIDTSNFADIAHYPSGMSPIPLSEIAEAVRYAPERPEVIPAVFSHNATSGSLDPGVQIILNLHGNELTLESHGTIIDFPTATDAFVIIDRDALFATQNEALISSTVQHELWVQASPEAALPIVQDDQAILSIVGQEYYTLSSDILAQSASGAFNINIIIMSGLSILVLFLSYYLSAYRRAYETGILQAQGVSLAQTVGIFATEVLISIITGIASGVGIGYLLSRLMIPQLSKILDNALANSVMSKVYIPWTQVGFTFGLLSLTYMSAAIAFLVVIWRTGTHKALRLGEE